MQGRYWIGTLYEYTHPTDLPPGCAWIKGQQEKCPSTGRIHTQIIAGFTRSVRLAAVKRIVGDGHWELTRSSAAESYVWKDDTSVLGTRFEFGTKPFKRNSTADWESIRTLAKSGELDAIPADVFIRYYRSLTAIASDNARPGHRDVECYVFWGSTGTGKSRRAWHEAGESVYAKDPRTKWWCGYKGETNVVIDEFRGGIDISHILRWLDRYPVLVETKGSARPLMASKIWITSNLDPRNWFSELDPDTLSALLRRLNITHFN